MDRDHFIQVLSRVVTFDFVKAYKATTPVDYLMEIKTGRDGTRSQIVWVHLANEDKNVQAVSKIGDCPEDAETLKKFLEENNDGYYSRICLLNGIVWQLYCYPLSELEPVEMAKAIDEVANYADHYENKYFGGADNA